MILFQLLSGKFAVQQLIKSFNDLHSRLFLAASVKKLYLGNLLLLQARCCLNIGKLDIYNICHTNDKLLNDFCKNQNQLVDNILRFQRFFEHRVKYDKGSTHSILPSTHG